MASTELINHPLFNDANLVAYYRMNTGALTTDSKGSFTLTNNNTVSETASGKFGYAATTGTSNTNKSLSINNDLGIGGGACSFSCWVKMNAEPGTNTSMGILAQDDVGSHVGYAIGYNDTAGTKSLFFRRTKQGVASDDASYTVTLGTSVFNNVVYTFDTTHIRGYLNGALVAGPTAQNGSGSAGGADKFTIGSLINFSSGALETYGDITIDDIAVFTDALTAAEVLDLYDHRVGGALFFAQL